MVLAQSPPSLGASIQSCRSCRRDGIRSGVPERALLATHRRASPASPGQTQHAHRRGNAQNLERTRACAHDVRDVHGLIKRVPDPPHVILADKDYDSEPLHEWLDKRGIRAIVPVRKGCRRGRHRTRLRDRFPAEEYAQRNIVESVFKRLKALFGGHVRGRTWRAQRGQNSSRDSYSTTFPEE